MPSPFTMMEPEYYVFTGRERVPGHVTHVRMADSLKFVRARAFLRHPNIEEVICHDGVEKIEEYAFYWCPSLRRVIMPGVKFIENDAFYLCPVLTYIVCGKLERVGKWAFQLCESLNSIDLPSIKIIERRAFSASRNLTHVKFGKDLKSIGERAFFKCPSLERITTPLKDGVITYDNTFQNCENLNQIDLVEGALLHQTIAALLMEEWKNDMNEEIESISQILPNTPAGNDNPDNVDVGGKAQAVRVWITSLLHKVVHYRAEHERFLNEAATSLQLALPRDILMNNVLTFLELPPHSFEVEDSEEDEDEDEDNRDASYSEGEESSYSEGSSSEGEESEDVEVDSEEDSGDEEGEEDDHLGEEHSNVGQDEDHEEYEENETAQIGRDKRQRR